MNHEVRKPMKSYIQRIIVLVLATILLYFWLTPVNERNDFLTWGSLFLFVICVSVLSMRFSMFLRRWRGLGALLALHIAAQAWLQVERGLWASPIVLIRNLNVLATLGVFGTLIAILISLTLLLVYQDASAIALASVWRGCPLFFILAMAHYGTLEQFSASGFRENILWLTPLCLLWFLAVAGAIAFLGHFVLLLIKEISGRELDRGQIESGAKSRG